MSSIFVEYNPSITWYFAPPYLPRPTDENWLIALRFGLLSVVAWVVLSVSRKRIFLWL